MRKVEILFIVIIGWSGSVFGYSANDNKAGNGFDEPNNTHGNLTRMAVERSNLVQGNLLQKMGLPKVGDLLEEENSISIGTPNTAINFFPNSQGDNMTIYQLLPFGVSFEDTLSPFVNSTPKIGKLRVFNHFYDPQNDGIPLTILGTEVGRPSLQWAIDDKDVISSVDLPLLGYVASYRQHFSYANAREYYYEALTNTDAAERKRHFGLTFQTLGHIVHHFQDMAQPQHVRNDTPYRRPRYET